MWAMYLFLKHAEMDEFRTEYTKPCLPNEQNKQKLGTILHRQGEFSLVPKMLPTLTTS